MGNYDILRKLQAACIVIVMIGWIIWTIQPSGKLGLSLMAAGMIGIALTILVKSP